MNTRALIGVCSGLIASASVAGFVVGYHWPRNPPDPTAKQLLALSEKMSVDVVGIQRLLARDNAQCPNDSSTIVPAKELAQANKSDAPVAAESDHDTAVQRAQAEAVVMRGVSMGRWTEADARDLREAMMGLSGDQKQSIVSPLLQAINSQQVKLEVERGVL